MSPIFTARVTTPNPDLAEVFFDNAGAVAQAIGLPQNGRTRIDAYFTAAPEFGDLPFAHEDFALEQVPDEDWVTRSQKNFRPCRCRHFSCSGAMTDRIAAAHATKLKWMPDWLSGRAITPPHKDVCTCWLMC